MPKRSTAPVEWENRIIDTDIVDPRELTPNPRNWRKHPSAQAETLEAVLSTVGWIQDVIVNQRTGHVLDGHLRVELAAAAGQMVPVKYVDVSPDDEALVLATFDPISAMAVADGERLADLLAELRPDSERVAGLLDSLRTEHVSFEASVPDVATAPARDSGSNHVVEITLTADALDEIRPVLAVWSTRDDITVSIL